MTAGFATVFKEKSYRYPLSVIAIFQNEDRFLKEWVDFHLSLGVRHFYLFNHLSTDNYLTVLGPYIEKGVVELEDWPYPSKPGSEADWTRIQAAAYRRGIEKAKKESEWVAILDTDEFLFPLEKNSLTEFLEGYRECSGILVNWQVFGTSSVPRIAEGEKMIERLCLQSQPDAEENKACKSLFRPGHVKYCVDPHTVVYYPWSYAVDPDKCVFPWKFHHAHPVKADKIRINHYWARDEAFFYERKIARNQHWGDPEARKKRCLERNDSFNLIENRDIQKFLPETVFPACTKNGGF